MTIYLYISGYEILLKILMLQAMLEFKKKLGSRNVKRSDYIATRA